MRIYASEFSWVKRLCWARDFVTICCRLSNLTVLLYSSTSNAEDVMISVGSLGLVLGPASAGKAPGIENPLIVGNTALVGEEEKKV